MTTISDLQRRLATERILDVFTMNPMVVRLQLAPPTLGFDRKVRFSADVVIRRTPRSTEAEVIHHRGHVFLLTDLCVVCERMNPEEGAQYGSDGPDLWLCYPPFAGKVLRISKVIGQDNALQVSILKKVNLIFEAESVEMRNFMSAEFRECIGFSGGVLGSSVAGFPSQADINELKLEKQSVAAENQRLKKEIEDMKIEHLKEVKRLQSIISRQPQNPHSTSPVLRGDVKGKGPARPQWGEVNGDRFGIKLDNSGENETNNVNSSVQQPEAGQCGRTNQQDAFSGSDPSHTLAAKVVKRQQREFEEEDRRLRRDKDALAVFNCAMCTDELPKDYVARLNCQHEFCRDCIRGYIVSKVQEHCYPILCPCCAVDKASRDPGVISEMLVQEIGIEEKDYQIFVELQRSVFSVLLHCRKCKKSGFVNWTEYQEQKHLVCPSPGCNYAWCKACQQPISSNSPQHSCDGTSKPTYCPGPFSFDHDLGYSVDAISTIVQVVRPQSRRTLDANTRRACHQHHRKRKKVMCYGRHQQNGKTAADNHTITFGEFCGWTKG